MRHRDPFRMGGLTQSAVHRIWQAFRLRPYLTSSVQLSKAPLLIERVRDIVGLYLSTPDRALVPCVDEKPEIHALYRGGATFPMPPGQEDRTGTTSIRQVTTTLIAALDARVRAVIGCCSLQHRTVEFPYFLEKIDRRVPKELAGARHSRQLHPALNESGTGLAGAASTLHLPFHADERVMAELGGVMVCAAEPPTATSRRFPFEGRPRTGHWAVITQNNDHPSPFVCKRPADDIMASIRRFCPP